MAPQLKSAIDSLIESNKIVVFMKGTKQFPQCGFSNTVVQVSSTCNTCRYLAL
jgi:monothiol glutaredoxin